MLEHAGLIIFPHVNGLRVNQSLDGVLTVFGGLACTLRQHFGKPLRVSDNSDGTFCLHREQAEEFETQLNAANAEIARRAVIVETDGFAASFDHWSRCFPKEANRAVSAIHRHADIAVITPGLFANAVVLGAPMPYPEYARTNGGVWEPGMQSWTFRLTDGEKLSWSFQTLIAAVSGVSIEEVVGWMSRSSIDSK